MTNNNYHGLLLEIHVVTFLGQEKTSLWRNMPLACPQVPSSNTRLYGWLPGAWGIASISSASESGYNRRVLGLFISSATFGNLYQRFTIYQPWDILYLFLPYVFALWHLQPIWSIFSLPRHSCVNKRKIIWDIWIRQILNLTAVDENKG